MIDRNITNDIWKEIDSKEFISIIGPRQAGKTTLMEIIAAKLRNRKNITENQIIIETFQDPLQLLEFGNDPTAYIIHRKHPSKKTYFFLDEFQYVDNAGAKLKLIYDTIPNIKILITGSSALKIREIGSSMVGRILSYRLNTLSLPEIISTKGNLVNNLSSAYQDVFLNIITAHTWKSRPIIDPPPLDFAYKMTHIIDDILLYGSYPAVFLQDTVEKKITRLLGIYTTYVEKDIVQLLQIGKSQDFLNLTRYLALTIGGLFKTSSVQSELDLSYHDTQKFTSALTQTYIVSKVTPFHSNKVKELKKSPLYYFNDTGLRNWSIQNFQNVEQRTDRGHLIENYIHRRLKDIFVKNQKDYALHYWRKNTGAEVDFVIDRREDLIPVEIKYKNFSRPTLSKSFRSFLDDYQPKLGIVITKDYTGSIHINDTHVLLLPYFVV
jgi:uncharacterized protein